MTAILNTIDGLMERHVAGTLPLPLDVMAQAHLELKTDNRAYVDGLMTIGGQSLCDIDPVNVSADEEMLSRIWSSEDVVSAPQPVARSKPEAEPWMPKAIRSFVGTDTVQWRTKMPGFREYTMDDVDGCEISLFWIKAGRAIPTHTHEGSELTLVLDGGFSDGIGHYVRGDISIADNSVDHRPVADDDGPCIGFAVTTDALRLTGSWSDRLRDIIGR